MALLLSGNRLVTLTGMGGVGKTRLAMRLWRELAPDYADGITLVDLAPLAEVHQVDEAVAAALGVGGGEMSAEAGVVSRLQGRRVLLIIDNAEHLNAAVARLLGRVLASCPLVSALVTSRDSLGLPGETVFRLSPLDVPPEASGLTAGQAMAFDFVRLLVDRAQALLPGFELDDEAAQVAAAICRRLDGIALAIEMAVPRLEVLSLPQLAERVNDRFGGLAPPRHDVLPRQRTLRTMFDWSWELLTPGERRLLQLLAISVAGTTLGALEALASADAPGDPGRDGRLLEQLTRLAQGSLVVVTRPGQGRVTEPRTAAGDDQAICTRATAARRAHRVEPAARRGRRGRVRTRGGGVAGHAQCPVAEPLRTGRRQPSLGHAVGVHTPGGGGAGSAADGGQLLTVVGVAGVAAAGGPWLVYPGAGGGHRGDPASGRGAAVAGAERDRYGRRRRGELSGRRLRRSAVRAAHDPVGLSAALWRAASTVLFRDHTPSAAALLQQALLALAGRPASKWQALCLVREADLLMSEGALSAALAKYDQAITTMRTLGYGYGLMVCGGNRGYALFELGQHDEAIAALRGLASELPPGLRHPVLSLLATMLAATGADEDAHTLALEGLDGTVTIGMISTLARSIEALALLAARAGNCTSAARLLGFVLARHPPDRMRLGPRRMVFDELRTLLAKSLPVAERDRLLAESASWTETEAMAAAMSASETAGT